MQVHRRLGRLWCVADLWHAPWPAPEAGRQAPRLPASRRLSARRSGATAGWHQSRNRRCPRSWRPRYRQPLFLCARARMRDDEAQRILCPCIRATRFASRQVKSKWRRVSPPRARPPPRPARGPRAWSRAAARARAAPHSCSRFWPMRTLPPGDPYLSAAIFLPETPIFLER